MAIRAVVMDIDGTLTDYNRLVQVESIQAVHRAEANGIPVMMASGNIAPVVRSFMDFVGASGPGICENGGVVYDRTFRKRKLLADRAHADRAVGHLKRLGFDVRPLWSDRWRESEVALELNLDERAVQEALSGWRLHVVGTRFAIHITEPGLNKHQGTRAALTYLKMTPKVRIGEILAIGDSNNDVEMLRAAGHSAVVANATAKAVAAAKHQAGARYGAGVLEILEHYHVI